MSKVGSLTIATLLVLTLQSGLGGQLAAREIKCAADEASVPDDRPEGGNLCMKKGDWEEAKRICRENGQSDPMKCVCQDGDTVGPCGN